MDSTFINIRVGRYVLQAWRWRARIMRMNDEWVAKCGLQPRVKVWRFFGYRA